MLNKVSYNKVVTVLEIHRVARKYSYVCIICIGSVQCTQAPTKISCTLHTSPHKDKLHIIDKPPTQ